MILSVVVNTVVLGMDRFDIDKQTETVLGYMNSVFTYIFIIELTMKLIAVGPSRYLSDKMNYMDGGVVLMSIVELVINSLNTDSSFNNFWCVISSQAAADNLFLPHCVLQKRPP